jgi:hypothetical protein
VGSRNAEVGKKEGEKVGRLEGGRIKVKGERIMVEGGKERRWEDRKVRRWEKAGLSDEDWGLRVPEVGMWKWESLEVGSRNVEVGID